MFDGFQELHFTQMTECCRRQAEAIYCLVMGCELNTPITRTRWRARLKRRVTESCCPHCCATPLHAANGQLQICELLHYLNCFLPFSHLQGLSDDAEKKAQESSMLHGIVETAFINLALSGSSNIGRHPFPIINIHGESIRLHSFTGILQGNSVYLSLHI